MPVPYMANALRGWTKPTVVNIVTVTKVDFLPVEALTEVTVNLNKQPMPSAKVNRKPAEQRTWKWWSIIVKEGPLFKANDKIDIGGIRFVIQSGNDWTESGFQKYEAIEDYEETT